MSGNRRRVLFVSQWAATPGGAEYSLLDILTSCSTKFECHLLTSEHGQITEKAAALGIAIHVIPVGDNVRSISRYGTNKTIIKGLIQFGQYLLNLRRFIKTINPDCIHTNIPKSHITIMALRFLTPLPVVILHMREIFAQNSIPYRIYELFFSSSHHKVIAISNAVKNALSPKLQLHTIVIHNGVKIPTDTYVKDDNATIKLLYLGRIVPWKRCLTLISIFEKITTMMPQKNITLSIIGDTRFWNQSYRKELESAIALLTHPHKCILMPHTNNPYIEMVAHDIFINASLNEPFGRVIAEAQACYMPVVTFDSGGINEIILNGKSGYLIEDKNEELFVEKAKILINDLNISKQMGITGHERMKRLFNKRIQVPIIAEYIRASMIK